MKKYCRALTIAGSDSGGGAGIQADLKTFSAFGCYGMSALTAITAQNTCEVSAIHAVPADIVTAQIKAVIDDIGVDAVKIGMLNEPKIIAAVAACLDDCGTENIVLDPVMVAKSGDKLLQDDAVESLRKNLIPKAIIITPNIPEAEVLSGLKIEKPEDLERVARSLLALGPRAVLLKGGHFEHQQSPDYLVIKDGAHLWLNAERTDSVNTHGTGCTLSSAIAASLALGTPLEQAVKQAKNYITQAIAAGKGYQIGHGHGPVKHFYAFWQD
ncbi:MAG: bifunctional hydroxymethylpyrimidine kinase/phosphomethylpyrimidine kinase [Desulfuromusa sp.]|nr:bifunctional hydroxymethylpyrimidine kinase/phosphomethylpyrimidine kinase [Desulfuromusa sp.]